MSDEEIDAHNNAVSRDEAKALVAELKMAKKQSANVLKTLRMPEDAVVHAARLTGLRMTDRRILTEGREKDDSFLYDPDARRIQERNRRRIKTMKKSKKSTGRSSGHAHPSDLLFAPGTPELAVSLPPTAGEPSSLKLDCPSE